MKKCLALLLVALLTMSVSVFSAFADDSELISLDLSFNTEANALSVSGHVVSERDSIPMTLYISGTNDAATIPVAAEVTVAEGQETKGVPFRFDAVKLSNSMPGTTLTISVTAGWLDASKTVTYEYIGVVDQIAVLKKLNAYIAAGNTSAFDAEVMSGAKYMAVEESAFSDLTGTGRTIALKNLMSLTYTLPDDEDGITAEEARTVKRAVVAFGVQYQEATELGAFFNLKSVTELGNWYDENKGTYGFSEDVSSTPEDETKMLPYVNEAIKDAAYLNRRSNMEDVTTMAELNIAMKHQALLQAVRNGDKYDIKNIITDFASLLDEVDYEEWGELSDADKLLVCTALSGKNYESLTAFANAINKAADNPPEIQTGSQSGNKTSGGGRGGSVAISGAVLEADKNSKEQNNEAQNEAIEKAPFTDLGSVFWAEEAITKLYQKGIVSGRSETSFAPDASVTRAELVKMLVVALGLQAGAAETAFDDVDASAWYAPYVSAAVANGLITGDENGNFHPNQPVSRQDAATILYRSCGKQNSVQKADFADGDAIAEYAKEAVNYMFSQGIINGMGNGEFAPLTSLSRAQLAKMIYLMIF